MLIESNENQEILEQHLALTRISIMQAERRIAAFTLVELLVVIGSVALLIFILLPTLGRARLQARRTQDLSKHPPGCHRLCCVCCGEQR